MHNLVNWAIAACAALFVVILGIAAAFDPSIRVLHVFEALPYLAAAVLCLRRKIWGYALAAVSGGFWLWTASCLTTFVRNGFERVVMLARTGSVDRLDLLIAAPAAIATGGMLVFAVIGYVREPRKSWRDLVPLLAALVLVPAFFLLIFAAFAPQYLGMFKRLVGH